MLKGKKQVHFYTRQSNSIILHLNSFCERCDPDEIHHLRVCYKKIKAFSRLQNKVSGDKNESVDDLKKIFENAAGIRQAAVNLKIVTGEASSSDPYIQLQKKIISEDSKQFCSKIEDHTGIVFGSFHAIRNSYGDIGNKDLKKYFLNELDKLKKFFGKDLSGKLLHHERMKLKDLVYIHEELPDKIVKELKFNVTFAERLQQLIGDWHDLKVVISDLENQGINSKILPGHLQQKADIKLKSIHSLAKKFKRSIQLR
jgi:CHAD domain-containing protein